MQFDIERKGYNKAEVDEYIAKMQRNYDLQCDEQLTRIKELKKENEMLQVKLTAYKNKESLISKALIDAMARAKKIEENSRKIYDLEIQKIRILYVKYKNLLDSMMENSSGEYDVDTVAMHTRNFKAGVNKVLSSQNQSANLTQSADEKMRALLNRMNNSVGEKTAPNASQAKKTTNGEQISMDMDELRVKPTMIKPIYDNKVEGEENFENLVDKFLDSDEEQTNAYANQILHRENNTNGFDLKEAVNPTESLEDIMKAFDFYDEDNE